MILACFHNFPGLVFIKQKQQFIKCFTSQLLSPHKQGRRAGATIGAGGEGVGHTLPTFFQILVFLGFS